MVGSTSLGYISDRLYAKRSPIAFIAIVIASILSYTLTFTIEDMSKQTLLVTLFFFGFFTSGLNNLVQGSCASDIGKAF